MPDKLPNPLEVVDAGVDVALEVPKFPGRLLSGIGGAVSSMGGKMQSAVTKIQASGDDGPPDPADVVGGVASYVLAIPGGVVDVVKGAVDSVGATFNAMQSRIGRL